MRATYLGELFPTDVRATLSAFVSALVVMGGSLGLVAVGLLADVVDPSLVLMLAGGAIAASTLIVGGLPETVGADMSSGEPA